MPLSTAHHLSDRRRRISPGRSARLALVLLAACACALAAPLVAAARTGAHAQTHAQRRAARSSQRRAVARQAPRHPLKAPPATPAKASRGPRAPTLKTKASKPALPAPGSAAVSSASPGSASGTAPEAPRATEEAGDEFSGPLPPDVGQTVTDPIDARELYDIPFGRRSFWIQPWRAYLDTWPASRLLDALGIGFPSNPAVAEDTAQLLHDSGYRLARMGISWNAISFEDPSVFAPNHLAAITTRLTAMRDHGLRPLIVLDANSGGPTPLRGVQLETLADAPLGAQSVKLSPASAALVVPGRTGFNRVTFGGAADDLITSVNASGVATLSRPLLVALPAGVHGASTLRFGPFESPTRSDGSPNPAFQETLDGWLMYVDAVNRLAASVLGAGGYDIEVWNELSFGSQFLNAGHYYAGYFGGEIPQAHVTAAAAPDASGTGAPPSPAPELEDAAQSQERGESAEGGEEAEERADEPSDETSEAASGEAAGEARLAAASTDATAVAPTHHLKNEVTHAVIKSLLAATVADIRDPRNGYSPSVSITNGFASQSPFWSGAKAPLGLTALSKHPYTGPKFFPAAWVEGKGRPVNALGQFDTAAKKSIAPLFIPTYQSLFPEYALTDGSTETLIRDLAPFTTYIYRFPHGREVAPPGGAPLQKWVTEFGMRPGGFVVGPDGVTPQSGPSAMLSQADEAHFQAKVILRSLVSDVAKGLAREYAGRAGIPDAFLQEAEADPHRYPGDAKGGEAMSAMRDLVSRFQGPGPAGPPRQLTLGSIVQSGNHAQFAGDGTAAHPSLYDRDVLAVFPFQSSPSQFVIPVYVMTRDLMTLYHPGASPGDIGRFDLPGESFEITLGNMPEAAADPSVSAYDPLLKSSTPARLVSRSGRSATFEVTATDYPRLLSISYSGSVH